MPEPKTEKTEPRRLEAPHSDDFLADIQVQAEAKAHEVKRALESHKKELEAKYGEDLELKRYLADFARQHRLDLALISLWEEVRHYPAWSKRQDSGQWNKLGVTDCEGHEGHADREDVGRVSFILSGIRYEVVQTRRRLFEGDIQADFALSENGTLVFGINTSVDYNDGGADYSCFDVFAFKERGSWARMLLNCWVIREIESGKRSLEARYFKADEIKEKLQE